MSTILISAGEASGEQYGAQLMNSLRRTDPRPMTFFGLGGERMRAAGCEITVESRDVAVVGLAEVVKHLPGIYSRFKALLREVDRRKPDVAVLIDFPDFNFRLARALYQRGIPVVYFVSPQLWAWRQGRIKLVQKYVKKMLVIFPFEEKFYHERKVDAEYVGHPLADSSTAISREDYARANGLDASKQWIALLPGSRKQEVERNLPELVRAAAELRRSEVEKHLPLTKDSVAAFGAQYEFLLPVASTLDKVMLEKHIGDLVMQRATGLTSFMLRTIRKMGLGVGVRDLAYVGMRIHLVSDARSALAHARASIVASGTATVEAALAGNPFVVVYRVSPLTYTFGRHLVSVPHYAMANLIAEKRAVPELIQGNFTAENIVKHLRELIPDGPARAQMMADLAEVKRRLHPFSQMETASDRAAKAVLAAMSA
jgi:lipid-A-disaccharide synthase